MNNERSLSSAFLDQLKVMHPHAWSRLVDTFSPIVYAWCRKSGLQGHDAADVVQEVFASVARGLSRFDKRQAGSSFRAWLATITRTRIADHFRKNKNQAHGIGGSTAYQKMVAIPDLMDDSASQITLQSNIAQRMLQLIQEEFEPKTWSAFWLTSIENLSAAEAANQLEMNIASVYQARCRVLRRLKQRLNELPN